MMVAHVLKGHDIKRRQKFDTHKVKVERTTKTGMTDHINKW